MNETNSRWGAVLANAERLLQLVGGSAPNSEIKVPTAHAYILGMFWRSLRLYDGALLLLKAALPEEAAFLARSLFEESLRLQQLATEPESRDALVLGWANESISEKIGLIKMLKSIGLDQDVDAELASLDGERQKLQGYRVRHGVPRLQRFLSVKDAAIRYERREDYWTFEWAHESVHGSDAAWLFARRSIGENSAILNAKTDNPILRTGLAEFAARSLTVATTATFTIFRWPVPAELNQPLDAIRSLLAAHPG